MTYLFELITQIKRNCPDIQMYETHYTVDGIVSKFIDKFDGQKYVLKIVEDKENKK
jgi:hypothetical protein